LSPQGPDRMREHLLGSVLAVLQAVETSTFDSREKSVQTNCDTPAQELFAASTGSVDSSNAALDYAGDLNYTGTALEWILAHHSGESTVRTATVPGTPWQLVAGAVTVPATVGQLVSLLTDDSKRQKYDTMFKGSIEHFQVDARTSLKTLVYRGVWPVTDRRFQVYMTWQPFGSSDSGWGRGALVGTRSVPSKLMPPMAEENAAALGADFCVLGQIYTAGFSIQPLETGLAGPACRVTMVSHIDFAGDMPVPMINYIQSTVMPGMLNLIRNHAAKEVPASEISAEFRRKSQAPSARPPPSSSSPTRKKQQQHHHHHHAAASSSPREASRLDAQRKNEREEGAEVRI